MGEVRRPVGRHRPQEAQGTTVVCQGSRVVLVPNWYCLSGSSDSMIRLWDIGQQRCIHSYAVHTDSVWALAITPSFSHVYSGGRDQAVPVYKEPSFTIPGVPAIVQHEILNNRRHVLTKETAGSVKSWDITRGVVIEDFGKVSFEDKRNELFEMATIPAWFTMDAQLGCLFVHLDTPQCFSAESYEVDLNIAGAQEEKKQLADILYYEILDIPLPELQGLKTLRVAFHHATNNEVSLHFIRLPKGSTLFELIKDIKSKVQLSCSDTELRLFEVFHHRICGGQWVQVKFRRRDFESES